MEFMALDAACYYLWPGVMYPFHFFELNASVLVVILMLAAGFPPKFAPEAGCLRHWIHSIRIGGHWYPVFDGFKIRPNQKAVKKVPRSRYHGEEVQGLQGQGR